MPRAATCDALSSNMTTTPDTGWPAPSTVMPRNV
jgi:hypothetical protein